MFYNLTKEKLALSKGRLQNLHIQQHNIHCAHEMFIFVFAWNWLLDLYVYLCIHKYVCVYNLDMWWNIKIETDLEELEMILIWKDLITYKHTQGLKKCGNEWN